MWPTQFGGMAIRAEVWPTGAGYGDWLPLSARCGRSKFPNPRCVQRRVEPTSEWAWHDLVGDNNAIPVAACDLGGEHLAVVTGAILLASSSVCAYLIPSTSAASLR
jgi:hypothetical protein